MARAHDSRLRPSTAMTRSPGWRPSGCSLRGATTTPSGLHAFAPGWRRAPSDGVVQWSHTKAAKSVRKNAAVHSTIQLAVSKRALSEGPRGGMCAGMDVIILLRPPEAMPLIALKEIWRGPLLTRGEVRREWVQFCRKEASVVTVAYQPGGSTGTRGVGAWQCGWRSCASPDSSGLAQLVARVYKVLQGQAL